MRAKALGQPTSALVGTTRINMRIGQFLPTHSTVRIV